MKRRVQTGIWVLLLAAVPLAAQGQGNFEFGFHYSRWSLNIIKGYIEDGLGSGLESTFRDDFLEEIQALHPDLTETGYDQTVDFDSEGNNFGVEVRWYPGGRTGSFSLGLSVEKTTMTVSIPTLAAEMDLSDGSTFTADADAEYFINPLSFHLSFRWDILPSQRVHPFVTAGFGAATGTALENSELTYGYSGERRAGASVELYSANDTKTLSELRDEMEDDEEDFFLPGFIPFVQLSLGVKGEITDSLSLVIEGGIWNGFILRGGVSFRL